MTVVAAPAVTTPAHALVRGLAAGWRIVRSFILPRLLTLLVISAVTFFATSGLGLNIARQVLGRTVSDEAIRAFNHEHGFDLPVVQQYLTWLGRFLAGDWGTTPATGTPIFDMVIGRLIPTLALAALALAIAVPVSMALGVFMAKRVGSRVDLVVSMITVVLAATPVFVIGIVAILVFSVQLGITPVDATGISYGGIGDMLAAFVLPTLTLVLTLVPHITRITRSSVWETISAPYTQAGVLRGLGRRLITYRYLLPNAAAPIVNAVALDVMWLVTGLVLVESVFGFPGLGSLLVNSVLSGDVFTVQATVVVSGALFLLISLTADLLVIALTPKLRTQS